MNAQIQYNGKIHHFTIREGCLVYNVSIYDGDDGNLEPDSAAVRDQAGIHLSGKRRQELLQKVMDYAEKHGIARRREK